MDTDESIVTALESNINKVVISEANTSDQSLINYPPTFYTDGAQYWEKVPASVGGMLGGAEVDLSSLSEIDLEGSNKFLNLLFQLNSKTGKERALDGGAGIGRVTKEILIKHFSVVDVVEQNERFLNEAQRALAHTNHRGQFTHIGLQDFTPEIKAYDLIWLQGVLLHLTDEHLVAFLKRCKLALKPNGFIIFKENITSSGKVELDPIHSVVTRPRSLFIEIIQEAGLRIVEEEKQLGLPKNYYEVRMFALQPSD